MNLDRLNILLADNDADDCFFFKKALEGSYVSTHVTTVPDGEHLMQLLKNETYQLPDVLFLDLDMPRKNGFECLSEIKLNSKLQSLPVVVFSTSFEQDIVNQLYQNGAQYYIRKPSEFLLFEKLILHTLLIIAQKNSTQPTKEEFVITLQTP